MSRLLLFFFYCLLIVVVVSTAESLWGEGLYALCGIVALEAVDIEWNKTHRD